MMMRSKKKKLWRESHGIKGGQESASAASVIPSEEELRELKSLGEVKMKGVIDDIRVQACGKKKWVVMEDFEWYGVVVPAGFETDFASVPALLRAYINPVGLIRPAALVHDFMYYKLGDFPHRNFSRKECDIEFYRIMDAVGMDWHRKRMAYMAVRIGGWVGWRRRKKELECKKILDNRKEKI